MSTLTDATALVPVPGVSIIGRVVDFLTSFIKGKTKHAQLSDVNQAEHDYRNAIAASFSGFTSDERIAIVQKARPLLLDAMNLKWGMGGQGQPALAVYARDNAMTVDDLAGAMFSWAAVNVDASSADELRIDLQWAWQYVFVTAMQQAGLDPTRVKGTSTPTGTGTTATTTTQAGLSGSIILVVVVVGIMIGLVRRGRK